MLTAAKTNLTFLMKYYKEEQSWEIIRMRNVIHLVIIKQVSNLPDGNLYRIILKCEWVILVKGPS